MILYLANKVLLIALTTGCALISLLQQQLGITAIVGPAGYIAIGRSAVRDSHRRRLIGSQQVRYLSVNI